jgi:hypothetical protein
MPQALLDGEALLRPKSRISNFPRQSVTGLLCFLVPMPSLDDLLEAEGDQHAQHDDADLLGELVPAVKCLGQVDVHQASPLAAESREQTALVNGCFAS